VITILYRSIPGVEEFAKLLLWFAETKLWPIQSQLEGDKSFLTELGLKSSLKTRYNMLLAK